MSTIYVAITGSDTTGDGSEGNPYATLGKAVTSASSNDTVQAMDAGPYAEGDISMASPYKTGVSLLGAGSYLLDDTVTEINATGHTRGLYLTDNATLEHLWVHGATAHGVEMTSGSGYDCYCTHVRSSGNGSDGFHAGGNLSTFDRCQADGNGGSGFYVTGASAELSGCLAYGNTSDGVYAPGATAAVENCTAASNGRHGVNALSGTIRNVVAVSNTQYGIKATAPTVYSCDAWDNGYGDLSGTVGDAGTLAVDPLFTDAAGDDYTLMASSPCVGAGATRSLAYPADLAGVAWATPPAMGAFEYVTPPPPPTPPSPPEYDPFDDLIPTRIDDLWSMEHLVTLSLFTDARDGLAEGLDGHGGWWGDMLLPESEPFGSLIWTYFRKPANAANADDMATAAKNALRWLISQGLADSVDVQGTYTAPSEIDLLVTVHQGERDWTFLFADLWSKYV